jgi:hypothetical protein
MKLVRDADRTRPSSAEIKNEKAMPLLSLNALKTLVEII